MGYPLITSYIIGLAIGIGIFYIAENLPEIIEKGKTPLQKRLLAAAIFSVLFIVFYVLGIFRTTTFKGGDVFDGGSGPLYFACLNLFFTAVAMIVVYFTGLSRDEKKILDKYKTAEDEAKELKKELDALKLEITKVRKDKKILSLLVSRYKFMHTICRRWFKVCMRNLKKPFSVQIVSIVVMERCLNSLRKISRCFHPFTKT